MKASVTKELVSSLDFETTSSECQRHMMYQ